MAEFHMAVQVTFISEPHGTDEQFEAFLDEVVTQLDNINRDVSLAARLTERVADFATLAEASDFQLAASGFLVDLRTALHTTGCITAGWPNGWPKFEATEHVVRELEDADA